MLCVTKKNILCRLMGPLPFSGALIQRGLLASIHPRSINMPAVLVTGPTLMQNSPYVSFLTVAETITSTHCAYPRMDGQAELAWAAGYIPRWYTRLKTVIHPSTNRAQRRVTWLVSILNTVTATQISTGHCRRDDAAVVWTMSLM